jgi:hypothetical protein
MRLDRRKASCLAVAVLLLPACLAPVRPAAGTVPSAAPAPGSVGFTDVAERAGLHFVNEHGSALPLTLVETMGGGAALLDYDGDGWLDIYLISAAGRNGLFRNDHHGGFEDVTARAGVADAGRYHMGVCAADVDNDGRTDLYLTNYGRNTLLLNRGDGTFADVTEAAGVGDTSWSVSCAFLDYDRDGWPDLYVANYVSFESGPRLCTRNGIESNCPPFRYTPAPHKLYHNLGHGRFEDASERAGVARQKGRGMGVVAFDYNDDGWPDLAVANDNDPNFLFRNQGDGTFKEVAGAAGSAYSGEGRVTSSMGLDFADVDGDGRLDFVVTNFQHEVYALFHNLGRGMFSEEGALSGLTPTQPYVGWGVGFIDFDNDGDKDLFFANGHVHHNIALSDPSTSFAQPQQLFENRGGAFVDVSQAAGPFFATRVVGRGAAFGDYDNDGDVDVLINALGEGPHLLRNDGGNRRHWLSLELHGPARPGAGAPATSRSALGARVTVRCAGERPQLDEVRGGGSYASSNDPRLHFGLGEATEAEVEIRWPDGSRQTLPHVPANRFLKVVEGTTTPAPSGAARERRGRNTSPPASTTP